MARDRYSHGHHDSVLRSHRWRTAENSAAFLLPHLVPGLSLLDVGCGPGNITADFARRLGEGSAIGIDLSSEVIDVARAEQPATTGVNLSFQVGDVYRLDFPDGAFDVVHAHQVLQHLSDPVAALREMRRVLKTSGLLAVREADYGAFTWSPADARLDRWLDVYHQLTKRNGADDLGGRRLKSWVRAAGFNDVTVSSSTWTFSADEERAWWGGLWAERVRKSQFASQSLEYGLTTDDELDEMAQGFEHWLSDPDGVFFVVHGEVLARP